MAGISQSKQLWHCIRDTQGSGMSLGQTGHVPSRLSHLREHLPGEGKQALADGREAQRPDVLFDQSGPVMALQCLHLVRQRGLSQKQPGRRLREACRNSASAGGSPNGAAPVPSMT